MNIRPKNKQELESMRAGGAILNQVLRATFEYVEPGKSLKEIDGFIAGLIKKLGAKAAFLGYHDFPASSCLSVNSAVVHGIPNEYVLKGGDILGVDVGVKYEGYFTDAAFTMPIGNVTPQAKQLLAVTQEALRAGIEQATAGNRVSDIGAGVEDYVLSQGKFGIIRDLAGHGVGQKLQELPEVLNVKNRNTTPLINGMTLAIEPMICTGRHSVRLDDDNWTVLTQDNSLAAQFETTIIVHDNDPEILVPFPLSMRI